MTKPMAYNNIGVKNGQIAKPQWRNSADFGLVEEPRHILNIFLPKSAVSTFIIIVVGSVASVWKKLALSTGHEEKKNYYYLCCVVHFAVLLGEPAG